MSQVPAHKRSFAAWFRRDFEAREAEKLKTPIEAKPHLERYKGQAITRPDESGQERYVYKDGSLDPNSIPDERTTIKEAAMALAVENALETIEGPAEEPVEMVETEGVKIDQAAA